MNPGKAPLAIILACDIVRDDPSSDRVGLCRHSLTGVHSGDERSDMPGHELPQPRDGVYGGHGGIARRELHSFKDA